MRVNSVLLVLLLVVAGAAAPLGASADTAAETNPLIVSINGTANYLAIPTDEVSRSTTGRDGLSLSTAVAGDTHRLRNVHARTSFERSFRAAATNEEKTAAIESVAERIEHRTAELEERDRAVVRAYADGTTTTSAFVRERARIHQEARELQTTVQRVDRLARADDGYSLDRDLLARLVNLSAELEVLQGPVSERVAGAAAGTTPAGPLYVEASSSGYTLAYVTDDTYVRETFLGDERRPNETDTFTQGDVPRRNAAHNRGYELYPWVTNHSVSPNTFGLGLTGIYRFSVDFTDGELTAYLDGATTNVFRESQRHKLAEMPTTRTVRSTNGSLRMRLNRTYETGPTAVSLVDNETGGPVNATVTADGDVVGHTGSDGTLWFVEPSGSVTVAARTANNESVSVYLPP